jgi:hypothetical protein
MQWVSLVKVLQRKGNVMLSIFADGVIVVVDTLKLLT